jgi:hypothetical protein
VEFSKENIKLKIERLSACVTDWAGLPILTLYSPERSSSAIPIVSGHASAPRGDKGGGRGGCEGKTNFYSVKHPVSLLLQNDLPH